MSAREKQIIDRLRAEATQAGGRLFRNNVGTGWTGRKITHVDKSTVLIEGKRPLHSGLATGSADLIGWTPRLIEPSDVGQTIAVFTSIEVKTGKTRVSASQRRWLDAVLRAGGIAEIYRE